MSSLKELLPSILEKSREAKLDWEEYSDTNFGAVLGNLTISIEKKSVRTQKSLTFFIRYQLALRGQSGNIIDQITGTDDVIVEQLKEVYDIARRRAYRVDESLSELKDILGNL